VKLIDPEKKCIQCGACVHACPINEYDENFIVYLIFFKDQINFDIWRRCCSCFLCEENCPQGLSPRDELFRLRRDKFKDNIPENVNQLKEKIQNTGFIFDLDDYINEERSELKIPILNLKTIKDEINKILKYVE